MDKPKAIFITTPSGPNFYKNHTTGFEQEYPKEEKTGLTYHVVRDKLNKLLKVMNYPDITNQDHRMIEGILIKFDRSDKISGEDMKICNELWKKYRDKR